MVDILFEGIVVLIDCQAISFCLKIKFLRSEAPAEGSRVKRATLCRVEKKLSQRRCVRNQKDPKEYLLLLIFPEAENHERVIISHLLVCTEMSSTFYEVLKLKN